MSLSHSRFVYDDQEQEICLNHGRIERAFRKYFYRADRVEKRASTDKQSDEKRQDLDINSVKEVEDTRAVNEPKNEQAPNDAADETTIENKDVLEKIDNDDEEEAEHEFEIIVGHGNVIRYFFCRALQLPPEAWLRMSLFNCSMTYIMIQPHGYVSVRMLGDTGHLNYDDTTFSGMHGYNWQ
jgi:hypothetical protein